VETKIV